MAETGPALCAEKVLTLNSPVLVLAKAWVVLNRHAQASQETVFMTFLDRRLRSKDGAGLVTAEVPHSGIAVKVAQGLVSAVVHDNSPSSKKQRCWDIAPVKLILEEAGGFVCNLKGGELDIWGFEPFVMAQSKELAELICALLA